jgi:hypothetical protein
LYVNDRPSKSKAREERKFFWGRNKRIKGDITPVLLKRVKNETLFLTLVSLFTTSLPAPSLFLFGAVCCYVAEREGVFDLKRSLLMIYREERTF